MCNITVFILDSLFQDTSTCISAPNSEMNKGIYFHVSNKDVNNKYLGLDRWPCLDVLFVFFYGVIFLFSFLHRFIHMKMRLFTVTVMQCGCIAKGFNCMINFLE